MGQGVFQGLPLALSGVRRIVDKMDWGSGADFISFGEIGPDEVDDETDVYILVAPQNVVGVSLFEYLKGMTEAAEAKKKPIVLVNPRLDEVKHENIIILRMMRMMMRRRRSRSSRTRSSIVMMMMRMELTVCFCAS